ncbi:MAG: hypothetical protein IKD69_02270, partial [Solobacterium sp.]|nr:hypothetical protein [Solobacterium sp.]
MVLTALTGGCRPAVAAPLTFGAWIMELNEKAGIQGYQTTKPYYVNVGEDSIFYEDVQAAVEYKVLDVNYPFDPDAQLTKEMTAYTLVNLMGRSENASTQGISDINDALYKDQVAGAVSTGLMKLDDRHLFHPRQVLSKEEAESYLDLAVSYINHKGIEDTVSRVVWKDDIPMIQQQPTSFDPGTLTAEFAEDTGLSEGDYVSWADEAGTPMVYRVTAAQATETGERVNLEVPDLTGLTEEMEFSGSDELDFSNAQITLEDGTVINGSGYHSDPHLSLMSTRPLTKSLSIAGYNVSLSVSSSAVKAEAKKKLASGADVYAALKLSGLSASYQFKTKEDDVRDAYFRLDFDTEESLGMKKADYKELYGDFSELKADAFPGALVSMWKSKADTLEDTLTLCTIKVPMPSNPTLSLQVKLQLILSANGKAQITLLQENSIGCEIRDGSFRLINEHDHTASASVSATSRISGASRFDLCFLNATLMDARLSAGARMNYATTLHLYDEEGNDNAVSADVPLDYADEMAAGNSDVLVCGDVKAYWTADAVLNSSDSLAGRLGFGRTFNILNAENAPLFPGMKNHIENLQFVDHCTRRDRVVLADPDELRVTEKICLS